jgi:hypothetical protein
MPNPTHTTKVSSPRILKGEEKNLKIDGDSVQFLLRHEKIRPSKMVDTFSYFYNFNSPSCDEEEIDVFRSPTLFKIEIKILVEGFEPSFALSGPVVCYSCA